MKKNFKLLSLTGAIALTAVFAAIPTMQYVQAASSKTETQETTKEEAGEEDGQDLTTANTKTAITEEQAKQIALDSVKGSSFNTIELEDEDGVIVFGVEVQTGNQITDVKVDANTGNILKSERGNEEDADEENAEEEDGQELTIANTKTAITEEQAKQIALDSVQGGTFNTIELEDEDGVIVFGVEIQTGNQTTDVKVDVNTGTVLTSDQDSEESDTEKSDNDNIEHENENEDAAGYED